MSSGSTNFYSATSKSATSNGGTTSGTTSGSGSSSTIRTSRRMVLPKPGGSGTSTSSTSTTATRRTTGAASRPRQTYRASSARGTGTTATTSSLPLPSATGAATAATTTTATSSSSPTRSAAAKHKTSMATATATARARGTTTTTTAARSTHLASRTAPSRPVGSYYASSTAPVPAATPTHASSLSSSSSSAPAPIADAGGEESADHDTWEDWGSPAPKAAPHASAAAGAGATTNEWYSAPATYTSSGFGTQPAQQQQQQQQPMQPGNGFYQSPQTQQEQQPFLSGAMDSSAPNLIHTAPAAAANPASGSTPSFSMFLPSAPMQDAAGADTSMGGMADAYDNNFDPSFEGDEAPLLEELGINVQHILLKTKTVVVPFSRFGGDQIDPKVVCQEADLPGPVALLLLLGGEMVLTGKLQFGFIYVYGLLGCMAMTLVTNLISPTEAVSFWTVTSIMGYSLLPVNILALIKIFVMDLINLQKLGNFLGALTVLWSTLASTRLLEMGCGLRDQRYLIMYPLLLFYSAFVMMTIF